MSKIDIKNKIFLAPMAGYTDQAFRVISFRNGVDIAYSEMVSAKAMAYEDKKTFELLAIGEEEKTVGIQIFGSDPEILGLACKTLDEYEEVDIIDLNIGCPAPKIVKNGEGSALMENPSLVYKLLSQMRKNTTKTLSAKIRLGINEKNNYLEVAKAVEEAGVDYIIVHGRTREQFYSGQANWEAIGEVKSQLNIPVVGNGDINLETDIQKLIKDYNPDALMIGRAAVGSPWIFKKIKSDLLGLDYREPTIEEKFQLIIEHINLICNLKPERVAIPEMRKHIHSYLKGMKGSAKLKNQVNYITDKNELIEILQKYRDDLLTYSH